MKPSGPPETPSACLSKKPDSWVGAMAVRSWGAGLTSRERQLLRSTYCSGLQSEQAFPAPYGQSCHLGSPFVNHSTEHVVAAGGGARPSSLWPLRAEVAARCERRLRGEEAAATRPGSPCWPLQSRDFDVSESLLVHETSPLLLQLGETPSTFSGQGSRQAPAAEDFSPQHVAELKRKLSFSGAVDPNRGGRACLAPRGSLLWLRFLGSREHVKGGSRWYIPEDSRERVLRSAKRHRKEVPAGEPGFLRLLGSCPLAPRLHLRFCWDSPLSRLFSCPSTHLA